MLRVDLDGFRTFLFRRHHSLIRHLEAPVPFNLSRPYGIPADAQLDTYTVLKSPQNYTVRVPHGSADHQGFVFDHLGQPIHGACQPVHQQLKYRWRLHRDGVPSPYIKAMQTPQLFSGRMAVVTAWNQGQYYHWLFDALPKLALVQKLYPEIDYYYLPQSHPFQIDSLGSLGLGPQKIVNAAKIAWVSSDELIVPCHQIMTGHRHPQWLCTWLRNTFLPEKSSTFKSGARIFISRAKARNRTLINEEQVFSVLSQLGFEYYVLEDLGFFEQVALFEHAEVIVAPHGSGLGNLVFCRTGTKVIELLPSKTIDSFYRLCSDANLVYAYVQTRERPFHRRLGEDFSINLDDLKAVLQYRGVC